MSPASEADRAVAAPPTTSAVAFIAIDGIAGESKDARHIGQIDVLSFEHGASRQGVAPSGGGGGAGKVALRPLSFTHLVDKASPALFAHCATGKHIPKATLSVRKAGQLAFDYYKITLQDVTVTSVETRLPAPESSAGPVETVALSFGRFEISYTPQKPDGSAATAIKAGFDVKTGKQL